MDAPETDVVRRRIVVTGRVQGVFYRAAAEREAARLHVNGTVRNCNDGSVELVVEGPRHAVDAMVAWARLGPPRADVVSARVEDEEPRGERRFRVTGE